MAIDRRHFIGATAATGAFSAAEAVAAPATATTVPVSGLGVDAVHLGVRFNGIRRSDRAAAARDRSPRRRAPAADPRRPASIACAAWCCRPARG